MELLESRGAVNGQKEIMHEEQRETEGVGWINTMM